ncbi:CBS domain-containing protein [Candidatus Amarolinea aalborgensis]|jgi:acetoin utilization protein AcuB|uniref:CBS domain-containing protein n=1 Tax=Candidatus Amarolinea aalborgensis TaxID=2249329 RepID=UPI003BF96DB6
MTRVAEIMTENPVTVQPSQSIDTAITLMRQGNFRRLPVVENGRLVGIVTDRDMRRATNSPILLHEKWYDNFLLEHIEVGACMTPNPVTISPDADVLEAAVTMRSRKVGGIPVLRAGVLVGIITETDLLDHLIELLEAEQSNQAPT